jgi:hypothetical protein
MAAGSWWAINSRAASAITSAVLIGSSAGVSRRVVARIFPSASTTPAATFVPPMSTPMVRTVR